MSKEGEKNYLKNIGDQGVMSEINKPFSNNNCGEISMQLAAVISLLPSLPAKILDLGCGTGWTSHFFAKIGYEVVGLDISEDMIDCALARKNQEKIENLQFLVGDYEQMNFDNEFDGVIFFSSLHHSISEDKAIAMAYKALKKNGVCITTEPGSGHHQSPASREATDKYDVTEKDMPPKLIIKLGKQVGFKKFKIYPPADYINIVLYTEQEIIPRFKFLKVLFKFNLFRILMIVFFALFYKRYSGIVIMTK